MRSRRAALVGRQPVDVVLMIGESNTAGARNNLNELPAGFYTTDQNAFIWDDATSNKIQVLVPGPMEQQPGGAAYLDPSYTNTVGPCGEFIKQYRIDNPGRRVCFFINQQGGGRFSDAASRGRAANYLPTLTDGAYNEMLVSWRDFKAAAAAKGWALRLIGCRINLGANTASNGTETTAFETDLTNLISAMRRDMIGDTKVVLDRPSVNQTDLDGTNRNTLRTAMQNIVSADTARCELMDLDGCPVMGAGIDNIHFNAPAHVIIGEQFYYHCANLWYPRKEFTFLGGNPVAHEWRPGDLRNTITSNALQTAYDLKDGGTSPTQATSGLRPAIVTTTLPSGYEARYATGDGTDDYVASVATAINATTYGVFAAVSAPSTASKTFIGEGGSTINPFICYMDSKGDGSGGLQWFARNDAGTVFTLDLGVTAFNSTMNFVAVWETGGQVTGHVNGTSGTAQSYTRGTLTLDRFSLFGLNYNGSASQLRWMNAKVGVIWTTSAVPDATYLANAKAYCQRRWGTV